MVGLVGWSIVRSGVSVYAAIFALSRFGTFQYGFLHFGHTLGNSMVFRLGTHSWPQRSQRQALTWITAIVPPVWLFDGRWYLDATATAGIIAKRRTSRRVPGDCPAHCYLIAASARLLDFLTSGIITTVLWTAFADRFGQWRTADQSAEIGRPSGLRRNIPDGLWVRTALWGAFVRSRMIAQCSRHVNTEFPAHPRL